MYINNVTYDDDSVNGDLGVYECHAFAVGDVQSAKHGFTVSVITSMISTRFFIVLSFRNRKHVVFLSSFIINLLAFYHECRSLLTI